MTRRALLWVCAAPLLAADAPSLGKVASGIELHYNALATLQIDFVQKMDYIGRPGVLHRGVLYLRRPGKMRWDYTVPAGQLMIGDGEEMRRYNPYTNQVRVFRIDETGDYRAPLSFLLGRLNFSRQFNNLRLETREGASVLLADGRTGKEAYSRVEFFYEPGAYRLNRIRILGRDESVTEFIFEQEQVNLIVAEELFRFVAPPGAEILTDGYEEATP